MTEKTVSAYRGYGHRVQMVRRNAVAREYAIIDNRKVICSSWSESVCRETFLNHVASIVRQTSLPL